MMILYGGKLLDGRGEKGIAADVLVEGGTIRDVGKPGEFSSLEAAESIDCSGKWVVPGLIDLHTHLREPGFEWKETVQSGTRAAIAGGFTSLFCMPNTNPVNDGKEVTQLILRKAEQAGLARVFPIGAVSEGSKGQNMAPLSELFEAGCRAFSDDGVPVENSLLMRRALEWASMLDAPLCCHEEDRGLAQSGVMNESSLSLKLGLRGMNAAAEEVMIARDIELARLTRAKVHFCHVSSARGVELIRRAKNDGLPVTAEVTPHHLLLTEAAIGAYDTACKVNPPLRQQEDLEALRAGLAEGVIDAIASDHAPHETDSKRVEFSAASWGLIGLQTTLPLILRLVRDGVFSEERAIEALTRRPAEIMGLNALGTLEPGKEADITVIDPEVEWNFDQASNLSLSENSPFFNSSMKGKAIFVCRAGKTLFTDGSLTEVVYGSN